MCIHIYVYLRDLCAAKLGNENSPACFVGTAPKGHRGGLADEYWVVETNCFPCSCCCLAIQLQKSDRLPVVSLKEWEVGEVNSWDEGR